MNEYEESFSFDVLRASPALNQQIPSAHMTAEDALSYYEIFSTLSKNE